MGNASEIICDHVDQVKQQLSGLAHVTPESAELFEEVIVRNVYAVSPEQVRNHTVIDVGANQGMFTMMSLALGAPQVIAAEPVPHTYNLLCQNVSKAFWSHKLISVCKAVTHDMSKPVIMCVPEKTGHSSMYSQEGHAQLVNTCTLEQLVSQATQAAIYLKMDCEGAEWDIMMHTPDNIFDRISHVALEIHGDIHPEYAHVNIMHDRLTHLGYKLIKRYQMGTWWYNAQGERVRFDAGVNTTETWSK